MLKPKGSTVVNQAAYDIQELLRPIRTELSISNLMTIADSILALIPQEDLSIRNSLLNHLQPLAQNQAPRALKSWALHKISLFLCQNCKNSPSDISNSPLSLCNSCFNTLKTKSKCFNCLIVYNKDELLTPCKHFCVFCCNLILQKGQKVCKVCSVSIKQMKESLKSIILDCSKCKSSKSLLEDPYMMLQCGHFFCSRCLKKCISNKKCSIDDCVIKARYINLAIEYISDVCIECKLRKTRNKFFAKSCCPASLCVKCSKNSFGCPNCLTPLHNN